MQAAHSPFDTPHLLSVTCPRLAKKRARVPDAEPGYYADITSSLMGGTQADDNEDADAVHGGFLEVGCRLLLKAKSFAAVPCSPFCIFFSLMHICTVHAACHL
jgi:hypothetical protein